MNLQHEYVEGQGRPHFAEPRSGAPHPEAPLIAATPPARAP